MNNIYIHSWRDTTNSFKKEKIKPIKNELNFTKPIGGLWASNINAEYGWKKWCDHNEFKLYAYGTKPTVNIPMTVAILTT